MYRYTFTYYGWIPSYRDFDQDFIEVIADSLTEAWLKVFQFKLFPKSPISLVSVEDVA